ncbi:MAG: SDR family oxidoreductase [Thermoflexales bacterium]|nr:SDR family oxidoreductase [Thermoflexales bacterium]
MDLELANKVVLITGASGGLGRELALAYGRHKSYVVLHYYSNAEAAEVVAQSIEDMGGEALPLPADLRERASIETMLGEVQAEFGGVDILVNNAIAFEGGVTFDMLSEAQWKQMMDIVLTGAYHTTSLCVPYMRHQKWGRIVNIASRMGMMGEARYAHYTAAKAGLIGLTRALAKELGPDGVLVNAVAPTTILTPSMREKMSLEAQERMAKRIPLGRIATPEDIARVVLFLGSGWNTFVNGEVITVGGGVQQ